MPANKPNVLLLTGGEAHDFHNGARLITQALADRFNVEHTQDVNDLKQLASGKFASLVLYTQGRKNALTDDLAATMTQFVQSGGGVLALHAANDSFQASAAYQQLIGSTFIEHGPICEHIVRPTDQTHPIVSRTGEFRVLDQVYLINLVADVKAFAVAHWHGKDVPVAYQRDLGKGKVVYISLGHDERSLGNRHVQRMIERAGRVIAGETFNKKITAGVLGYGGAFNMGKAHSESIRSQHNMDVVAVCDLDPKRTEQAKQELGSSIVTSNDMTRFIRDGQFDMLVVILPHNLHASACIEALNAGKHVVTEKPFCITIEEADEMIAAGRRHNRMVSCFHNRRWDGDFLTILRAVRSGAIGEVFRIDAATSNYGNPGTWWRSSKTLSGGAMYDWGAHYCDWLLNIMNKRIVSVTGDFQKRKWHHVTNEDYSYALIRFEDGSTATLEQGHLAAIKRDGWRILGTEGGIRNAGPGQDVQIIRSSEFNAGSNSAITPPKSNWSGYYANIGNHLIMDERLIVTAEQARRAIGVIRLAELSAQQGGIPLSLAGEDQYTPDYIEP